MNWTAWNSLVAKALRNRPSATPSSAFATASATTRPGEPCDGHAKQSEGDGGGRRTSVARRRARTRSRTRAIRSSLASGRDIRRSSVPPVRSRSIAIDVIRNMMINGNMPTSGTAIRSKRGLVRVEDVAKECQQSRRDDENERERPPVAAELLEDAAGCCARDSKRHRASVTSDERFLDAR